MRRIQSIIVLATCVFGPPLGALAQGPLPVPNRVPSDPQKVIASPAPLASGLQISSRMSR